MRQKLQHIDKLLPLTIITATVFMLHFEWVGHRYFENHVSQLTIAYIGIFCVVDTLIGIRFLDVCFKNINQRKYIVKCAAVAVSFIIPIVYAIFRYNSWSTEEYNNTSEMISLALQFIVFKIPVFFCLMIIIINNSTKNFVSNFKYYGMLLMPFCIFYILRIVTCTYQTRGELLSVGEVDYMSISAIALTVFLAIATDYIYNNQIKRFKPIMVFMMVVLWLTVLYSGTRSMFLCGIAFVAIILIWELFLDKRKNIKKALLPICITLGITIFSFAVWSPSNSGIMLRMNNFMHETSRHDIEVTVDGALSKETGEMLQNAFIDHSVANNTPYSESLKEMRDIISSGSDEIVKLTDNERPAAAKFKLNLNNRITLWSLAVEEFLKKPVLGNGFMYYQNKYGGYYPHCVPLELLADTGLVGTVIFFGVMIFVLIKSITAAKKNKGILEVVIISLSFIPIYLLSCGFNTNVRLVFTLWLLIFIALNENVEECCYDK